MGVNKRRGEPAIPPNHESLLTAEQIEGLEQLARFGWHLYTVRRPKFEPVEVVVEHSEGKHLRLLENGELDYDNPPDMRKEEVIPQVELPEEDPWADAHDADEFVVRETAAEAEPATVGSEPLPSGSGAGRPTKKFIV